MGITLILQHGFKKNRPKRVVSWGCCTELVDGDGKGGRLLVLSLHNITSLVVISQLLLFIPPSPKTPYFSIQ